MFVSSSAAVGVHAGFKQTTFPQECTILRMGEEKGMEMSRATTTVVYDGPGIANGAMDVQDFAPALLSVSQLCKAANREVNGAAVEATTYIRADIRKGSFEFSIDVATNAVVQAPLLMQAVKETLATNHDAIESATNILALIFGGGGVFEFLRWLRNRKPELVERDEKGQTKIQIGRDVILIKDSVFVLSENQDVRRAVEGVVKPLQKEGINRLEVGDRNQPKAVIATAADAHAFAAPIDSDEIEGEILADSETITVLGVVRPYLGSKGHRWGLNDGFGVHGYEMKDETFLEKVNKGIYKFGKGDAIRVRLRRKTWMDPAKGLQSMGTIVEVLGKIDAPEQMSLLPSTKPKPKRTQRRR